MKILQEPNATIQFQNIYSDFIPNVRIKIKFDNLQTAWAKEKAGKGQKYSKSEIKIKSCHCNYDNILACLIHLIALIFRNMESVLRKRGNEFQLLSTKSDDKK